MNYLQSDVAAFNAGLAILSAALLLGGWATVKRRRLGIHRRLMGGAVVCSAFLLASCLYVRYIAGSVPFHGLGPILWAYNIIRLSLPILTAAVVLMVVRCLHLALTDRFAEYARLARRTLPLWLCVLALSLAAFWLRYERTPFGLPELVERIDAAVEASGAPAWAGKYRDDGGYHGPHQILTLSPEGYYLTGNRGWVWTWGTVEPSQDGVFLLSKEGRKKARILRLIPWDDRVYAVFEDKKLEFFNDVNKNLEPDGRRYVWNLMYRTLENSRRSFGESMSKVAGVPRVPALWRPFLLERPVQAAITEVGRIRYTHGGYLRRIEVKLDAGRRHGLLPGLTLHLRNFEGSTKIVITEVGEDSSSGEARQYGISPLESQRLPWVGQRAVSYLVFEDIWE